MEICFLLLSLSCCVVLDGVINGNYRCNLSGSDLNRKWHSPDPILHPTVYHVKEMIRRWKQVRTVGMVLDLHGHSRKQGIFAYGCIPDKRHMRPSSPMSMLVLSNAQKQMAQSGSMKELGNSVNSNSASRVNLRSASICASGTNSQNCSASTSPVPSASGAGVILNMNPSISNAFLMGSSTSSQDIMYAAGEIEKSVMAMCALPQGTCTAPNESDTKEIPLEVSLDQYDEENENVFCLLDIGEGSKVKSRSTSPSAEDNSANVLVNNISIPKLSCIDVVPLPPKGFFSLEGINAGATGDGGNVDTSATVNSTVAEPSESSGSCENSNRSVTITGPGSGTNSGNNSGRDDTTKVPGTSSSGVNSGGMVTSVSQLLALPGGNSAANIFAWNNMVSINSATIVDVREDLPPEGCIPPKRDIHAWRNRLFPRIMEVYSPMFSLEYCR